MVRHSSLSCSTYTKGSNLHRSSEVLLPNLHGTLQRKNVRSCVKIWQTSWFGKLRFKALLITKFCSAVSNSFFLWISNQVQPVEGSPQHQGWKLRPTPKHYSLDYREAKNININQGTKKPKNLLQSSCRIHQLPAHYLDGVLDVGVTGRKDSWGLPPKRVNEDVAMYFQECKLTYKSPGIKKNWKHNVVCKTSDVVHMQLSTAETTALGNHQPSHISTDSPELNRLSSVLVLKL